MQNKQLSKTQEKHIETHVEKHLDKQVSKHLITKSEFFRHQFKQHVSTAIIAAFSFLIALTWKDLIVHGIESLLKKDLLTHIPYLSDIIAAAAVTIIAILGIFLVTRWAKKPEVLIGESTTS